MNPIQKRRRDLGKKAAEIASRAGISTSYLSLIERGYVPNYMRWRSLAAALDWTLDDLKTALRIIE